MEDDGDFDGGGYEGGGDDTPEPEDSTSRADVEEAVITQKQDKGDPDPHRSDRGYLKGRNDTAHGGRYEGLESYAAEARRNGTSIQNAVKDYAAIETAVRRDPAQGFIYAAQRMGLDPRQLTAVMYQHLFGPQGNQVSAQHALRAQYDHHARSIEAFRADPSNKYFDHVRMDMARLVQSGRATALPQAYRLAVNPNPQLRVMAKMERMDSRRDADMKRARGFKSYGGY